jgi:excinuclease ABC subunit C
VTLEEQQVVSADFVDQDVIGYHRDGVALEIVVMSIRAGKLSGNRAFSFTGQEFPDAELLSSFVGLYYDMGASVPRRAVAARRHRGRGAEGGVVDRTAGRAGAGRAQEARRAVRAPARRSPQAGRAGTQERRPPASPRAATRAPTPSWRWASCSAGSSCRSCRARSSATTSRTCKGFATVASMVVFVDGRPDKARYRTYKVRRRPRGGAARTNDDFASMYEVLSRRFRRAKQADDAWKLPDLIVVDGGKGQLAMALAAARDVGISVGPGAELSIVALAKEREEDGAAAASDEPSGEAASDERSGEAAAPAAPAAPAVDAAPPAKTPADRSARKGDAAKRPDRVFLPHAKDAIPIRPSSGEMFVLQALRDEAHRFAVSFHRGQRRRLTLRSALASIPGIGLGRQRQLLRHFGSIKRVREASVDDLASVPGMTRPAAGGRVRPLGEAAGGRDRLPGRTRNY